ncbi:alpha/beta hydrolase fold domain-containing protein [Nonomuraea sp. NPDC050536]|uniref:alpha/beta hydrolase fold domain-containing protein n=1 Tax=Nonomuraea sp. NPDC050536 TaxID=3364366 RepID=UPI0037CBAE39
MIELRHLRAFVAVADELNFGRAAQRLYISQPALSRQIRALERLLGCDVFRRSTQRVELTAAGETLLSRTRPLLADLDEAILTTRSVGGELEERMARLWEPLITASATTAMNELRMAVEELHGQYSCPEGVTITAVIAGGTPALRLVPPEASDTTVLYLHGGGHVAGSAFGYKHLAGAVAAAAGARALIIDYRLAPEHPYPASLQDSMAAYQWLLDTGVPPGRVVIAGDSSGGGLVMSLLIALREREIPRPAGAVLLCPWVDLEVRAQEPAEESAIVFSREAGRFARLYLAGQPVDEPALDPLHTDLSGLPPLLVHAASGDSIVEEARLLVAHGRACGVDTTLRVYGVPTHVFHTFWSFLPEAAAAMDDIAAFIAGIT